MNAREAESVAIRLDDTFRRFRLEAHPTYFAGIQEETLAALINANKRAELIQLAVDAVLTLMVAVDKSSPPLSRTTRERFLKMVVLEMARGKDCLSEDILLSMSTDFLTKGLFPTSASEFLVPFFEVGLLYRMDGLIYVTHPYVESYLLAQALRDEPDFAKDYFDPQRMKFNSYVFDIYCELGPTVDVVDAAVKFAHLALSLADDLYPGPHPYLSTTKKLAAMSNANQLQALSYGLIDKADKIEKDDSSDSEVRNEKQKLLDAGRYVRNQAGQRSPSRRFQDNTPNEIRTEFELLDALSRSLLLVATAIGAGSESLGGDKKVQLANLVILVADRLSDVWTRNRLRIDFICLRDDILADENVWKVLNEIGASDDEFDRVRYDLEISVYSFELNAVLEPLGRVLSQVASSAGIRVLQPVLEKSVAKGPIQALIKSTWMLDVDAAKGRVSFKNLLADYNGSPLIRLVLASHLLWRVYWHHYKTAGARHR